MKEGGKGYMGEFGRIKKEEKLQLNYDLKGILKWYVRESSGQEIRFVKQTNKQLGKIDKLTGKGRWEESFE